MTDHALSAPETGTTWHLAEQEDHDHGGNGATVLGFWIYLMSDALIFASLFAMFGVVSTSYAGGPVPREIFDLKLVALNTARERERQFAIQLDAARNSAILARSQYRTGLTDFTTLSQQEAALLSAQNGLVQARSDAATAQVSLFAALGGGWDADTIPQAPPLAAPTPDNR